MRNYSIIIIVSFALLTSCKSELVPESGPVTVNNVDLDRYLGKWYEIARFPHPFEDDLVGVTATYTRRKDGKIAILNAGNKKTFDGPYKEAHGIGLIPDSTDVSKLRVSFSIFFYADYYILELDTMNYQYALVGSSSDKYLWMLSRSPLITEQTYNMLVEKARARGYQVEKLIRVKHKPLAEFESGKEL